MELFGFLLHVKYLGTHNFGMFVSSHAFPVLMGIHSSPDLGIACIYASREIFKKLLTTPNI